MLQTFSIDVFDGRTIKLYALKLVCNHVCKLEKVFQSVCENIWVYRGVLQHVKMQPRKISLWFFEQA